MIYNWILFALIILSIVFAVIGYVQNAVKYLSISVVILSIIALLYLGVRH